MTANESRRCYTAETTHDCPNGHDWIDGKAYHGRYTHAALMAMIETNARAMTDEFLSASLSRTQNAEARRVYSEEIDRRAQVRTGRQ